MQRFDIKHKTILVLKFQDSFDDNSGHHVEVKVHWEDQNHGSSKPIWEPTQL